MAWNYLDLQLYIFDHDAITLGGVELIVANPAPGSIHLIY